MTARNRTDAPAARPCGFGIFNEGALLVAFPTEEKARQVLQECEQDGHTTSELTLHPIFQIPPGENERIATLEAELRQARIELATRAQERADVHAELTELRGHL